VTSSLRDSVVLVVLILFSVLQKLEGHPGAWHRHPVAWWAPSCS